MRLQMLTGPLPEWARIDHPILRYELQRAGRSTTQARLVRALGGVLLALILAGFGYLIATNFLTQPPGQNLVESLNQVVYWPLLVLQLMLRFAALSLTANVVSDEMRRQHWDTLRATPSGASLTMRVRWAGVIFYRLRTLLGVVLLVRIVLIIGMLWDLTAFQGRYLDLLISGAVPEVSLPIAVLLLALLMTATLLLPITAIGFDAALGLLLATVIKQRTYSLLLQVFILVLRILIVGALLYTTSRFLGDDLLLGVGTGLPVTSLQLDDTQAFALTAATGAIGDWGLSFLNLASFGNIWTRIPYGILLSVVLLIFAMLQAVITDQILALAVRRAEKQG